MNCAYKNYLYIYNIKLLEENTLLIEKKIKKQLPNMFLVLLVLNNFFINSTKHVFFVFENKNCFLEFSSQTQFFFLKTPKIVLKNCF